MNKLPAYLTNQFLKWQSKEGKIKTLIEFADYLSVNRSLLSFWMNGKRLPNKKAIEQISNMLGNEIYDVLDIPRPNPYLQTATKNWEFMPEEKQEQISRMIAEEAAKYEAKTSSERVQQTQKRGKKSID